MEFHKMTLFGITSLTHAALEEIQSLSKHKISLYKTLPEDLSLVQDKLSSTDCLLVSLGIDVNEALLNHFPNLKYIGIYGTSFKRIYLDETQRRGIVVRNVSGYCDVETAQFTLDAITTYAEKSNVPLKNKTLGIIGMGSVGKELANMGVNQGMHVLYFSRNQKPDLKSQHIQYVTLDRLLKNSDYISLQVPPNTSILNQREFDSIPDGTVLVSTCVGHVFDHAAFSTWIQKNRNTAIFDAVAARTIPELEHLQNVWVSSQMAYQTPESMNRLKNIFIKNMKLHLSKTPI